MWQGLQAVSVVYNSAECGRRSGGSVELCRSAAVSLRLTSVL